MITNTFLDYVTIRVSISALRLVAPASITYLLCCSIIKPGWWYASIGVFAAAEAAFYLVVYLTRTRRLQAPPTHPAPPLTRAQRQLIFTKCNEAGSGSGHLDDPQHQPYPTGWFLPNADPNPNNPKAGPTPTPTPTRADMIDWLLWEDGTYLTMEARWSERWVGGVSERKHEHEHGDGDRNRDGEVEGDGEGEGEGKLEVLFNPALDHAVIFDHEKWTEPLLEVVRRYVADV
ncbi:hypothetical protein GALMADRAFT_145649 [Galerina marginata CBS 339.88]|uniref:Uncharacterized protein n=1 Tax=Galerina marginata (strain CBS 339.88) TaxID=685588 RepID=A0A067SNF8_GALM3|nr:hypothetical protein GALMADRAFT_145649 [Galerina marginata CBS 339.88]